MKSLPPDSPDDVTTPFLTSHNDGRSAAAAAASSPSASAAVAVATSASPYYLRQTSEAERQANFAVLPRNSSIVRFDEVIEDADAVVVSGIKGVGGGGVEVDDGLETNSTSPDSYVHDTIMPGKKFNVCFDNCSSSIQSINQSIKQSINPSFIQ